MPRISSIILFLVLLCMIAGVTSESASPQQPCPDKCGDGPRDPHCCTGYHCVEGKCVKN